MKHLTQAQLAELERLVPRVGVGAAAKRLGVSVRTVCRRARTLDLPRPHRASWADFAQMARDGTQG